VERGCKRKVIGRFPFEEQVQIRKGTRCGGGPLYGAAREMEIQIKCHRRQERAVH